MHIDVVLDLTCPWCFIGKRRLERALAMRPDLAVSLSWCAFQLDPDLPPQGMAREAWLASRFGRSRQPERLHVAAAAAGLAEGIAFSFERIRVTPNTLRAHRLIRRAADKGCAEAAVEGLFRAFFLDGLDIGDLDVLAGIAVAAGLDRSSARRHLAGEAGAEEVRQEAQRARRLGIHAVPCFVFARGWAIAGAQEPEVFLPLLDLAASAARPMAAD